jgi:hypothetical protein
MRQEDILLNEAYRKVHTQEPEQLDELFGNVADARLAGVGGTISGLKNRVVGGLQKGVGSLGAKAAGIDPTQSPTYQKGQAKVQAGKDAGTNAKIKSILTSQGADIKNLSTKIVNQLNKLGLGGSANVDELSKAMNAKLEEVVMKQAPATTAPATPAAAPATPASVPAASTPASVPATPAAPVASGVGTTSTPEVKPTNTATQAAGAMASSDTGTNPPAATTGDDSKITDQGGSQENETTPEEVQAATPPANAPQPKVNKSIYQSRNANKDVYKFVNTQQGKVWKNQRTRIVPTAAVQSNITNSWIRQQGGGEQPAQQNESFKSFFWQV